MKFVIFDMDGVIFDTEKYWAQAYKKASAKFNKNFTEELRKYCCGRNSNDINKIFDEKFPDIDALEVRKFMADYVYNTIFEKGVELKSGFLEIIKFFKEKRVKLALATGSERPIVAKYFASANLDENDIFEVLVTGDMVTNAKPDPEVYLTASKLLGVTGSEAFAIEDSPNGVISARGAGLKTVFVEDQIPPDEDVNQNAVKICKNLIEAKTYFEQIFENNN